MWYAVRAGAGLNLERKLLICSADVCGEGTCDEVKGCLCRRLENVKMCADKIPFDNSSHFGLPHA